MQPRFMCGLAGTLCLLAPFSVQARTALECLDATGYAFEDNSSLSWLFADRNNSTRRFLFPADPNAPLTGNGRSISCAPPQRTTSGAVLPATSEVTAEAGATITSLLVSTGISAATSALVTPGQFHRSTSEVDVELSFRLNVVADDPAFTGDVPLTVKTRYSFGAVTGAASGSGRFTIGGDFDYVLQALGNQSFRDAWSGPPATIASVSGASFDEERVITVPANYAEPVSFEARYNLISDAQGGPRGIVGSPQFGDGKAQASLVTTFEFMVPEGFSVEFPMVAALGLEPPRLGVVATAPPRDMSDASSKFISTILPLLLGD